jgi:RNA polymerase sigma factor (sigma-70 family)
MRRVPIHDAREISRRHIPTPAGRRNASPPWHGSILLERYYRELLNFLSRTVNDRDAAADLAQESYARVLALRQSGEAISNVRALLYRTARNLVIDRHRRAVLRDHEDIDALADAAHAMAPVHAQPEEAYASAQHARAILAAIEALPPRCREAFVLNRFEGLSHQEVAERMGISKNMVAQHVIRGVLACKACEYAFGTGTSDHNR